MHAHDKGTGRFDQVAQCVRQNRHVRQTPRDRVQVREERLDNQGQQGIVGRNKNHALLRQQTRDYFDHHLRLKSQQWDLKVHVDYTAACFGRRFDEVRTPEQVEFDG